MCTEVLDTIVLRHYSSTDELRVSDAVRTVLPASNRIEPPSNICMGIGGLWLSVAEGRRCPGLWKVVFWLKSGSSQPFGEAVSDQLLSIGEIASMSAVAPSALRYYERCDLI